MDEETGKRENTVLESASSFASERDCPACGERARRETARFCSNCGRALDETYLPAEHLRASYNQKHQRRVSGGGSSNATGARAVNKTPKSSMKLVSVARNTNGASTTALAFVTYALVPYLGILFCPGALVMGGLGLYKSYVAPERGGRRASSYGIIFGLLIFGAQVFLWWILYKIPQWATQF